jgi:uncharacterized repeat protein (TIGR01451 family)
MNQKKALPFIILFIVLVIVVGGYLIVRSLLNPVKPDDKSAVGILPLGTAVGPTAQAINPNPTALLEQGTNSAPLAVTLAITADPQTYDHAGQTITYTYIITNSGAVPIGPTQFIVNDTNLGAVLNCGEPNTLLAPTEKLTCSATRVITQADLDAGQVASNATVSAGGSQASAPANATITKNNTIQMNSSNLAQGTSLQHTVAAGEWLWQIARCYGADPKEVIQANAQLADVNQISPGDIVNVPNIGSKGAIYGPPCMGTYTVQAGDTWSSIAQKFGASIAVLQRANPGGLKVDQVLLIPLHSAS